MGFVELLRCYMAPHMDVDGRRLTAARSILAPSRMASAMASVNLPPTLSPGIQSSALKGIWVSL